MHYSVLFHLKASSVSLSLSLSAPDGGRLCEPLFIILSRLSLGSLYPFTEEKGCNRMGSREMPQRGQSTAELGDSGVPGRESGPELLLLRSYEMQS